MDSEIPVPDVYKKGAQIGRGSFATITEATRVRNDQDVVLKQNRNAATFTENLTPDEQHEINKNHKERILSEAKVLAKLEHPNIVPVVDAFVDKNGDAVLVMKQVGDENLTDYLNSHQLTNKDKIRLIKQVSSAVDYTNAHNILHRDIKLGNVLVEDGNAFLTDFGNSSAVFEQPKDNVVGSPTYMSPEQTQGLDEPGDSEEYAVALLAYTLVTRQTVYDLTPIPPKNYTRNEEMNAKVHAVATRDGLPDAAKNVLLEKYKMAPTQAQKVVEVFDKALSRKPTDRYKNATEFADALEESMGLKNK